MPEKKERLLILSVPFVRLARMSLSPLVLGALRKEADVAIVAPFADAHSFQQTFGGPRTRFFRWHLPKLPRRAQVLLAASELMRRNGYWRRFRKQGMAYYVANELAVHGMNGADDRLSLGRAAIFRTFSIAGQWRQGWVMADRVLGASWARFPALEAMAAEYDDVTLVQSSNWGEQDRALSRLSSEHAWRRVLLPYTIDQLDVNGYLLNDFDVVCAQGPFEAQRAVTHHAVPRDRVREVGSAWLRHLDLLRREANPRAVSPFVLYAGASALYFPRESEFEGLETIARLVAAEYPDLRVVYRPVADDDAARKEIEARCRQLPGVSVQWPAITEIGLDGYSDIDHHDALRSYVRNISGCRAMVMSNITSLAIDVARVNRCGVVSNMVDPRGVLARRQTALLDRPWFDALRIARTMDGLVEHTRALLDDPRAGEAAADRLMSEWDFGHDEFTARLLEAIRVPVRGSTR